MKTLGKALVFTFLAAGGLLLGHAARAFTLSPMSVSFEPNGPGATRGFEVENDGKEGIAVELYLAPREIDAEGHESYSRNPEAEKLFLLYPPQLLLKPGEKRTIRVSWTGEANPQRELAFRIVAEQLPVKTEKKAPTKGGVINMLLKYVGAIYITPKDAAPQMVIRKAELIAGKEARLGIDFENKGTAHQVLTGLRLKIRASANSKAEPVILKAEELPTIAGQNILAGRQRHFEIGWPSAVAKGPVQVEFEIQE